MKDTDHSLGYKIWWYHQTQVVMPSKKILICLLCLCLVAQIFGINKTMI